MELLSPANFIQGVTYLSTGLYGCFLVFAIVFPPEITKKVTLGYVLLMMGSGAFFVYGTAIPMFLSFGAVLFLLSGKSKTLNISPNFNKKKIKELEERIIELESENKCLKELVVR